MARLVGGKSTFDRISRADFCRIDVVSVFEASAKDVPRCLQEAVPRCLQEFRNQIEQRHGSECVKAVRAYV